MSANSSSTREENYICSKPFTWFEVANETSDNEKGEVFLCCPTWLEKSIGNLQHQSVEEIWNSEEAQAIRSTILGGSFKFCNYSRCTFLQNKYGPVQKIKDIKDPYLREVIDKELTFLPYGPREINCSYDASCNLSCPSCRSDLIIENENKDAILSIQEKIQNSTLKDARLLSITGSGDPFGSPFFRKWLQSMKRVNMPDLEVIHLHTNALLWNQRTWNSIPRDIQEIIKSAEISIDASTPTTYSINRRGGNFKTLLKNLEFISSLRKNEPLDYVRISMVVQENNFLEMTDFISICEKYKFDEVYFSKIVNWGTYSEEEYKSIAIHLPSHPRHYEFLQFLRKQIVPLTRRSNSGIRNLMIKLFTLNHVKHPIINLGSLSELLKIN